MFNFLCVMRDGTQTFARGFADEGYDGMTNQYLEFDDDKYDCDDILYWMEIPTMPNLKTFEHYGKEKIQEAILDYAAQFKNELKGEGK